MKYFIYGLANTRLFQAHTYANSTGTTVLHLQRNAIQNFKYCIPSQALYEQYSNSVKPKFESINKNNTTKPNPNPTTRHPTPKID